MCPRCERRDVPTEGFRVLIAEQELTPGDPASVAHGRAVVARALGGVDGPVSPAVDDAVLGVSELVTNAIRAARERVRITVEVEGACARVAVYDDGPGLPAPRPTSPDRPHGRGLSIVDMLAQRWGVEPAPPGKWVWAEFPLAVPAPRFPHPR